MSDLHDLAAAYALDALDVDERTAFEAHLATCEICSPTTREFRETAALLAEHVAEPAPAELRSKVMAEIGQTTQLSPLEPVESIAPRVPWQNWALAAAAVALVIAGVAGALTLGRSNTDAVGELVAAPDAIVTTLEGEQGRLRIVYSAQRNEVAVLGTGLADVAAGSTYALWFLLDEGVAPAALFAPQDGGVTEVFSIGDQRPIGWGVTVEPEGGSPQPTTPVIYSGAF